MRRALKIQIFNPNLYSCTGQCHPVERKSSRMTQNQIASKQENCKRESYYYKDRAPILSATAAIITSSFASSPSPIIWSRSSRHREKATSYTPAHRMLHRSTHPPNNYASPSLELRNANCEMRNEKLMRMPTRQAAPPRIILRPSHVRLLFIDRDRPYGLDVLCASMARARHIRGIVAHLVVPCALLERRLGLLEVRAVVPADRAVWYQRPASHT